MIETIVIGIVALALLKGRKASGVGKFQNAVYSQR